MVTVQDYERTLGCRRKLMLSRTPEFVEVSVIDSIDAVSQNASARGNQTPVVDDSETRLQHKMRQLITVVRSWQNKTLQ
jgi:hypothetical protein